MKILINAAASLTLASVVLASPAVLADEFDDLRSSSSNMTQEQASNVEAGCGPCIVPIIAAGARAAAPHIARSSSYALAQLRSKYAVESAMSNAATRGASYSRPINDPKLQGYGLQKEFKGNVHYYRNSNGITGGYKYVP